MQHRQVEIAVSFHYRERIAAVREPVKLTERVDETRVGTAGDLQLEAVIELARLGRQDALDVDRRLIQERLEVAVGEQVAEELIVFRRAGAARETAFDQHGELGARLGLFFNHGLVLGVRHAGNGRRSVADGGGGNQRAGEASQQSPGK